MSEDYIKDCPCKICLVKPICNKSCKFEILWYYNLSNIDKWKYVETDGFQKRLKSKNFSFPKV